MPLCPTQVCRARTKTKHALAINVRETTLPSMPHVILHAWCDVLLWAALEALRVWPKTTSPCSQTMAHQCSVALAIACVQSTSSSDPAPLGVPTPPSSPPSSPPTSVVACPSLPLPSSASSISFSMVYSASSYSAMIKRNNELRGPFAFQMFFGCANCAFSQFKFHYVTALYSCTSSQ